MSAAGGSATREAARIRRSGRKGAWGHITAWAGMNPEAARADATAARWELGARAERATARLVRPLWWRGWRIRHDLRMAGRRFNIDHVLVAPCGTAVVVGDTKRWHAGRATHAVGGRLFCEAEDRHGEAEKAAGYARLLQDALGLPGVVVWPVLIVHGSPVAAGGHVQVVAGAGVVQVVAADRVRGLLRGASSGWSWSRARRVAARVDEVLRPYQ
ncbi:nuclease-related domain-containing protein [Streptomyces sp. NBRC 110035]|uniref:nuclease-related domain-containing protein n=1 Tax=Streptomyces sp. NBRC 110035 TaxID=1547867 RepID=UPI0005A6FFC8|nr:nuclease-related domain-containing protein [Streptomyces sp. NBRC 110035]